MITCFNGWVVFINCWHYDLGAGHDYFVWGGSVANSSNPVHRTNCAPEIGIRSWQISKLMHTMFVQLTYQFIVLLNCYIISRLHTLAILTFATHLKIWFVFIRSLAFIDKEYIHNSIHISAMAKIMRIQNTINDMVVWDIHWRSFQFLKHIPPTFTEFPTRYSCCDHCYR